MRRDLEHYYEQELFYVRKMASEFAEGRPKIADRLMLDGEGQSDDPHVERLIQAFSFLTARIQLKLDDEFPQLVDSLLDVLYPHYLAPIPSMSVVQFEPDPDQGQLTAGYDIERHRMLYSREVSGLPCRFRTTYPLRLWPLEVELAEYHAKPFSDSLSIPSFESDPFINERDIKAVIRIKLRTIGGASITEFDVDRFNGRSEDETPAESPNGLRFFLSNDDQTVSQLYELLFNQTLAVRGRPGGDIAKSSVKPLGLEPVGFDAGEGMLPYSNRSFLGYRLLTEFFCFPRKFHFFDLTGLKSVIEAGADNSIELFFFLDHHSPELTSRINAETFRLGCVPIVNLFETKAHPIQATHMKSEYRVVANERHQRSIEVYSVDEVSSTDRGTGESIEYEPYFACRHGSSMVKPSAYWVSERRASIHKNDRGTEVYLSIVDPTFAPTKPPHDVLNVGITCSNRDLPGELRAAGGAEWGFQLEGQAPAKQIIPVVNPTASHRLAFGRQRHGQKGQPSLDAREHRWRLVSHLSLNHLSITDDESGADALKEILRLYDYTSSQVTAQLISGISSVKSKRITQRLTDGVVQGFCRGTRITIEFRPDSYSSSGAYLFASVLDRFLALYTSINSFTQLVTKWVGSPEPFKTWPCRIGMRDHL